MRIEYSGIRRLVPGAAQTRARVEELPKIGRRELQTAAREAAEALSLRPALRLVLGELAGCYGEQQIARGLMVWPSNAYLVRKTGLAERTVRKCVRELTEASLIAPVDSANRKRFAIKSQSGAILDAFGFDLSPLWTQRLEWAQMLIAQREARSARSRLFDELTIERKAAEAACLALDEIEGRSHVRATQLDEISRRTPRRGAPGVLDEIIAAWRGLRNQWEKEFEQRMNESGYGGTRRRHQEPNNGLSTDPCKSSDEKKGPEPSVSLITEACPAVEAFGQKIHGNDDVIKAGRFLRASIGAHPSAWREASDKLGDLRAAVLVLIVLQLVDDDLSTGANRIKNPGGLFRDMARRCEIGQLNLFAELSALRRRHMG